MMRRPTITQTVALAAVAASALLMGCGEKVQTSQKSERKQDVPGWKGANQDFAAPGWKPSDEAAWQRQLNQRAQSQNEYIRVGAQKSGS